MPSFVSRFHIPNRGGADRTAQEKTVDEEKKWLHYKKARKHEACQKRGVSPSDDDDDDDD